MHYRLIYNKLVLGFALSALSLAAFGQPVSDFSASAESWGTVGKCPSESSPGATWSATGGNPGGMIYETDEATGIVYWNGSGSEWKADLTAYYGCNFSYDQKTDNIAFGVSEYDILLVRGDDHVLSYNTPYTPGLSWSTNVIPLSETGWIYEGLFNSDATCPNLVGTAATYADMISFLADIKRIRIRAEFAGLVYETNYLDNVEIICDPIPLAVEFTQFSAYDLGNGKAQLDWSTASESENKYFQVEKSLDGELFDSIGSVYGNGTTNYPNDYGFTDNTFTQNAYYRLRMFNYDNVVQFSNTVYLTRQTPAVATLRVDPNPATDLAQLMIGEPGVVYQWELMDLSGNRIYSAPIDMYPGWYTTQLDVSDLSTGMYIVRISTDHGFMITRFQVVR